MDILDRFIETAKKTLEEGYYDNIIENKVKKISLLSKLKTNPFTLITEIKHASPAGEYSFDNIDVKKSAQDFKECGSDAISVVVEPKIFKGNLNNILIAKQTGLPVLFKDFVMDERQILAAKKLGADVILLVVKVIERLNLDLDSLIQKAHNQDLEVLLEAYDEREFKKAMNSKADILGINNRDLQTLKVDLSRTANIIKNIGKLYKPLISESGIMTRVDAQFARRSGASGILVGTAIWKAQDLREKVKELSLRG